MRYIRFKEGFVLAPTGLRPGVATHSAIASQLRDPMGDPISAGFVRLVLDDDDKTKFRLVCFGASVSLCLVAREDDSDMLLRELMKAATK